MSRHGNDRFKINLMKKVILSILFTAAILQARTPIPRNTSDNLPARTGAKRKYAARYGIAGATFDVKVSACIAAVIAQGGGICDATGLIGAQIHLAEIDVGNRRSVPVTLLLSPYLNDLVTMSTPEACAFRVFDQSKIIGDPVGVSLTAMIQSAPSTHIGSLVCSDPSSPSGEYVSVSGLQLYNPRGGTFTNGIANATRLFDGSEWSNLLIANYGGIGLHVRSSCCHTVFRNVTVDGGHVAGSIPLKIDSLAGDFQTVNGVQFFGLTAAHPGNGLNTILITNTFTSSSNTPSADFYGLYMEGNSTDTTTPFIRVDSFERTGWFGVVAQSRSASSTQHVWSLVNTAVPGIRPHITIKGFNFQNTSQTLPAPIVDDVYAAATINSSASGFLPSYDNWADWMQSFTLTEVEGGFAPSKAANTATCYADSTSHTIRCSYNNGSYLNIPQLITTSFTTTARDSDNVAVTGMVAAGHCSLTPTNAAAATGIATVFVSAKTVNQITVSHAPSAGWKFDVMCFPQ